MQKTLIYLTTALLLTACSADSQNTSGESVTNTPTKTQDVTQTANKTTRTLPREDAIAKYAMPNSKFVDLDGVNVHYSDEGEGPAILLMHGTLGDLIDWNGWAQELQQNYRVIRFDLPGFGLTADMPNGNYSVDRMHTLIDSLMDHLQQEKFAIVGISYGGMVAFRYAATRTERITGMMLINSAGIEAGKPVSAKKTDNNAELAKAAEAAVANAKEKEKEKEKETAQASSAPRKNILADDIVLRADVEAFYNAYINDPAARSPEFIGRKLDFLNIVGRAEAGLKARNLYERGDPFRVLAHVRAPSLILWGEGNRALYTKTANDFVNALTKSCHVELSTIEGAGHYINVERPKESVAFATDFFGRILGTERPENCGPITE